MNRALEEALRSKPYITGMLCADPNGLTIAGTGEDFVYFLFSTNSNTEHSFGLISFPSPAKGELSGPSGRYVSITR